MGFKKEKVIIRLADSSQLLSGTIFQEIKRAGQLSVCFPFEKKMHEIESFMEAMEEEYHLYAVYYSNILCGAFWVNSWEFKTARIAFSAFKTQARIYFYEIISPSHENERNRDKIVIFFIKYTFYCSSATLNLLFLR